MSNEPIRISATDGMRLTNRTITHGNSSRQAGRQTDRKDSIRDTLETSDRESPVFYQGPSGSDSELESNRETPVRTEPADLLDKRSTDDPESGSILDISG